MKKLAKIILDLIIELEYKEGFSVDFEYSTDSRISVHTFYKNKLEESVVFYPTDDKETLTEKADELTVKLQRIKK